MRVRADLHSPHRPEVSRHGKRCPCTVRLWRRRHRRVQQLCVCRFGVPAAALTAAGHDAPRVGRVDGEALHVRVGPVIADRQPHGTGIVTRRQPHAPRVGSDQQVAARRNQRVDMPCVPRATAHVDREAVGPLPCESIVRRRVAMIMTRRSGAGPLEPGVAQAMSDTLEPGSHDRHRYRSIQEATLTEGSA